MLGKIGDLDAISTKEKKNTLEKLLKEKNILVQKTNQAKVENDDWQETMIGKMKKPSLKLKGAEIPGHDADNVEW